MENKSGRTRLYLYLGAMLIIAGGWRLGETINQRFATLVVKQAPRIDRSAAVIDAKSIYPVWVKQAVATAVVYEHAEVDALFRKKAPQPIEPPPVVEPDYSEIFKQAVIVDGVANDGVFCNGRFYKVGDKMPEFTLTTASGAPLIPVLESIHNGRVTFRIGHASLAFMYGGR